MSTKNIMLVCAAGMSTSMLVKKMRESAEKNSIDVNIFAVSANEADEHIRNSDISLLLLGPQVKFMKNGFIEKTKDKNIPVDVINMSDYGMMNGEKVLKDNLIYIEEGDH